MNVTQKNRIENREKKKDSHLHRRACARLGAVQHRRIAHKRAPELPVPPPHRLPYRRRHVRRQQLVQRRRRHAEPVAALARNFARFCAVQEVREMLGRCSERRRAVRHRGGAALDHALELQRGERAVLSLQVCTSVSGLCRSGVLCSWAEFAGIINPSEKD